MNFVPLMITCQVGKILVGAGSIKVYVDSEYNIFCALTLGVGVAVYQLGINLAHYSLAQLYLSMTKRVPNKLEQKPDHVESNCQKKSQTILYWGNVFSALLYGTTVVIFYYDLS